MFMPYWDHLLGFWNRRNDPNILFVKYEDMKTVKISFSALILRSSYFKKTLNNKIKKWDATKRIFVSLESPIGLNEPMLSRILSSTLSFIGSKRYAAYKSTEELRVKNRRDGATLYWQPNYSRNPNSSSGITIAEGLINASTISWQDLPKVLDRLQSLLKFGTLKQEAERGYNRLPQFRKYEKQQVSTGFHKLQRQNLQEKVLANRRRCGFYEERAGKAF